MSEPQKRILLYGFERGTGIGHLRKVSLVARQMQGQSACLIVTGHRSAEHWFVPEQCEYVHLPSWDSMFADRAAYWGRKPFLDAERGEAVRLRQEILAGVVRGFRPDAIIVDHLPLGGEDELAPILESVDCRKYLMTRGVQNETEDLQRLIFGGRAREALQFWYDRIFAVVDRRVFDFTQTYDLHTAICEKTIHTGYLAEPVPKEDIVTARIQRGLVKGDLWVVASAGGGQTGEDLVRACIRLGHNYPEITFDIVCGPRSNLSVADMQEFHHTQQRLRVHHDTSDLSLFHASADLVITSGGYATLLETLQGRAEILCFPLRKSKRDEQYRNAELLAPFVNVEVSIDLADLPRLFASALARIVSGPRPDCRAELDMNGAATIERIVLSDL